MSDGVLAPGINDPLALEGAAQPRTSGLWRDTLRNVLRQRSAVVGLIILSFLVFTAVFADRYRHARPRWPAAWRGGRRQATGRTLHPPPGLSRRINRSTSSAPMATSATSSVASSSGRGRRSSSGSRRSASRSSSARPSARWPAISRRMDRQHVHAAHGRRAGLPVADPGDRDRDGGGPEPLQRPVRRSASCRSRSMRGSPRASVLSAKQNDYVTASRALGESSTRHPVPADHAELADADRGRRHARASAVRSSRSPRSRSSASTGDISAAEWGSMIGLERNLFFSAPHLILFAGHRDHADGPRLQPPRRRPARRARSDG